MSIPVNPNTPRNSLFTRQFYLDQTKKTASPTGSNVNVSDPPSNFMIRGQIPTGSANLYIKPYEPVVISGEHWVDIDGTTDHTQMKAVRCYHILETGITLKSWGIAIDPITDKSAGRILIAGVSWLDTSSILTLIPGATHLNIIENALVQGYNGRACILQVMKQPHCLVELSNHRTILRGRTKGTALLTGVEGEVWYSRPISSGWEVTSITINAWTDQGSISANTEIMLFPIEGRYYAIKLCVST